MAVVCTTDDLQWPCGSQCMNENSPRPPTCTHNKSMLPSALAFNPAANIEEPRWQDPSLSWNAALLQEEVCRVHNISRANKKGRSDGKMLFKNGFMKLEEKTAEQSCEHTHVSLHAHSKRVVELEMHWGRVW